MNNKYIYRKVKNYWEYNPPKKGQKVYGYVIHKNKIYIVIKGKIIEFMRGAGIRLKALEYFDNNSYIADGSINEYVFYDYKNFVPVNNCIED